VEPADPAFGSPSKPIGPFFEPEEAERLARRGGWVVQPDAGRGHRRVVASPQPTSVTEIEALRALVEAGEAPGLLGYLGGRPVGWCAVAPRPSYPALARSRVLAPVDSEPVWSVSCLFVDRGTGERG